MHIEITGRMTGKTERLLKEANKRLDEGAEVVIVLAVPASNDFRWLIDEIAKKVPGSYVISYELLNEKNRSHLKTDVQTKLSKLERDQGVVWFFDEFDWYENQEHIPIMPTGYYTTTPRPGFDLMKVSGDRVINKLLAKAETFVDTVVVMPCNSVLRAEGMDFWGIDYVA
ncbi:hypothetical protein OR620_20920 [Aeromonas hydrophila]|uniref:hypothetical protein n=1 Tax=Aeromonas hydrophila TaxID=644 RepID=UPI00224EE0DE|nr:hypothetical protein [Aeromonas hydrophila]MCX4106236.1 hypothetical protein [Aeromonas hydrophila]